MIKSKDFDEYLPLTRSIWLVFDLDNGHAPIRRYVWWFDTEKDALSHIKHQKKTKHAAKLSKPYLFYPGKTFTSPH